MSDAKGKILIVEDEAPALLALSAEVESRGHTVLKAEDGAEGLEIALAEHPDVILADLKMPTMGGLEMIEKLREDAWGKMAEVIILTNATDVESVEAAMQGGTFTYLVKGDLSMGSVVERVESRLSSKKALG